MAPNRCCTQVNERGARKRRLELLKLPLVRNATFDSRTFGGSYAKPFDRRIGGYGVNRVRWTQHSRFHTEGCNERHVRSASWQACRGQRSVGCREAVWPANGR